MTAIQVGRAMREDQASIIFQPCRGWKTYPTPGVQIQTHTYVHTPTECRAVTPRVIRLLTACLVLRLYGSDPKYPLIRVWEQLMFNALRRVQIHFLERSPGKRLSLSEQPSYLANTHTRTPLKGGTRVWPGEVWLKPQVERSQKNPASNNVLDVCARIRVFLLSCY